MKNELTNFEFWENGWKSSKVMFVPKSLYFDKYIIENFVKNKSIIEIGGYPGLILAFIKLKYNSNVHLLDYYVDQDLINNIESCNGLPKNSIQLINTDFFKYKTEQKFDFVFSNGFIEHFADTDDVIKRHIDLMSNKSQLLILLPNLRGLNGLIHKWFDPEIYNIHNIQSMDLVFLKNIMNQYNLSNVKVEYINKPMVWISSNKKTIRRKITKKIVRMVSFFIKLFPIPCKFLSAYIVISAIKNHD